MPADEGAAVTVTCFYRDTVSTFRIDSEGDNPMLYRAGGPQNDVREKSALSILKDLRAMTVTSLPRFYQSATLYSIGPVVKVKDAGLIKSALHRKAGSIFEGRI